MLARRLGLVVLAATAFVGCASVRAPTVPSVSLACGWSLWRQEVQNRQVVHVKEGDYPDQPACLRALVPGVALGQPAWPMTYLARAHGQFGWLGCFPTVGYEPEKYK